MGRTLDNISYLTIALATCFCAYDYALKNGLTLTCFGGTLLIYILYSLTGLIFYVLESDSSMLWDLHSLGTKLMLSLSFYLYEVEVLLKDGTIPKEACYGIMAAAVFITLLAISENYVRYNYVDILGGSSAVVLSYISFTKQNPVIFAAEFLGLSAYYIFAYDVVIADKDPKLMSNFFHSGFLLAASQSIK